jgi:type II secretory pathway pseudopilin PulG
MNKSKSQSGMTLIETLVYLVLFAILFGGAISASYNVLEIGGRNQTKIIVQQEGDFLLAKIDWVLSGVDTINDSPTGELSVNKVIGLNADGTPQIEPVTINAPSGVDLRISYPNRPAPNTFSLSNSNIKIIDLKFEHKKNTSPNDTEPESIVTTFTITAKTENGADYSQTFNSTTFVRK